MENRLYRTTVYDNEKDKKGGGGGDTREVLFEYNVTQDETEIGNQDATQLSIYSLCYDVYLNDKKLDLVSDYFDGDTSGVDWENYDSDAVYLTSENGTATLSATEAGKVQFCVKKDKTVVIGGNCYEPESKVYINNNCIALLKAVEKGYALYLKVYGNYNNQDVIIGTPITINNIARTFSAEVKISGATSFTVDEHGIITGTFGGVEE